VADIEVIRSRVIGLVGAPRRWDWIYLSLEWSAFVDRLPDRGAGISRRWKTIRPRFAEKELAKTPRERGGGL